MVHLDSSTATGIALGTNKYASKMFIMSIRDNEMTLDELLAEDSYNFGITML